MAAKLTGTEIWTAPLEQSPLSALTHPRLGCSLGRSRPRPGEIMPNRAHIANPRRKVDVEREHREKEQVYCISKPAYQRNELEVEIGIQPSSSCFQRQSCSDPAEESVSCSINQPDMIERVEIVVDPQLVKCNPAGVSRSSKRHASCSKKSARKECDSLQKAVLCIGGVGVGAGAVPTVALAVPIMFAHRVDPLLAPTAENRKNQRLCAKLGEYTDQYTSQYTTQRFSRVRAKLSFVPDKKHACSKRRLAGLISLLLMAVCCLAVLTYFNTTLGSLFEDRDDRAEELSIAPVEEGATLHGQLATWSPWTEWSGCVPGIDDQSRSPSRSRSRQCTLNATGFVLADPRPCVMSPQGDDVEVDRASAGDVQIENCPDTTDTSTLIDSILSASVTFPDTHDSIVATVVTKATARHCDECVGDEVCVALAREEVPECRAPLDTRDPTGCAGHCLLGVEMCRQLDRDAFRCLEQQHCFESEFRCANLLCIPGSKRCDGHNNCYDESDEYDCACDLQTHFHCRNRTSCLPLNKHCDGIIDCWDGSDEANCTRACPGDEVMCASGSCIRRAYFCDGLRDCSDGSDEPFGCGERCHRHELTCANGRCVSTRVLCDTHDDCGDATDETDCHATEENSSPPFANHSASVS